MSALLPRRTTHHGVVTAHGLWFCSGIATSEVLQRRVLDSWEPGAQVFARGESYVLRLRQPRQLTVASCWGAPLTVDRNTLMSAPLRPSERAAFDVGAWLILIEGGSPRAFEAREWQAVDPADWLDLRAFRVMPAEPLESLGDPPLRLEPTLDPQSEIAQRLARTAEHQQEQAELLAALKSKRAGTSSSNARGGRPNPIASFLMRALFVAVRFVMSLFPQRSGQSNALPSPPKAPGLLQRLEAVVARWIARSRLMTLFARKQAEYLQALLDALEAHDDMEVLRRAVPLGDGKGEPAPPALTAPSLRTDFNISLAARSHASSIGLGGALFSDIRRAYEAVLARLTAAGKHEEAAFFLAEILNEPERAVDYLERQGRLLLAAQLAEARNLAPGLIVRQWFLAGDQDRALAIAVREGAFADAIARLERSGQHTQANALCLLHADRLASAGRWLAAARLVYARPGGAPLALQWLTLLREAGGVTGLALELSLDSQRFEPVLAALEPLLALRTPQAARDRALVAIELKQLDKPSGRPLARELTRELLADAAVLGDRSLLQTAGTVADWLGGAFRADFPRTTATIEAKPGPAQLYRSAARDAGTRPIFDACECGARFVVALGESGVLVLNQEAKRVSHFDTPAERLVVSQDGTRLLALTRRGHAWRVSQIDLATRRSRLWGELRADAFATSFDGQTWVIARLGVSPGEDSELVVLDVFEEMPSVLRRTPVAGRINLALGIQIDAGHCNVFVGSPDTDSDIERVRFDLPSWTLRERKPVESGGPGDRPTTLASAAAVSSGRPAVCLRWGPARDGTYELTVSREQGYIALPVGPNRAGGPLQFQIAASSFAVSSLDESLVTQVMLGSFGSNRLLSVIELEDTRAVSVRLGANHALIADDAGRLLVFDLISGRCIHDLRV